MQREAPCDSGTVSEPGFAAPPPDPATRVAAPLVATDHVTGFSGGPAGRPARPRRRWLGAALGAGIAIVVVAVLGLAADWAARSYEMSVLLDHVEASEAAMTRYQERAAAVELPDDPSDAEREKAAASLRQAAADGRDDVLAAGRDVRAVSFLPWHSELLAAQRSYLAHNQAWADHLGRGAADVTALLGADPMIDSTWTAAENEVRAAQPWPTLPGITDTVDAIFAPAEEDDGPPGLSV